MRKISEKQKQRFMRISQRRNFRRLSRKRLQKFKAEFGYFPPKGSVFRRSKNSGKLYRNLPIPADLSLATNHDEVLEFIEQYRVQLASKTNTYSDFSVLKNIGPCGALVIAAEYDRWRHLHPRWRRSVEPENFDPDILRQLDEMGLFEILNVSNPAHINEQLPGDIIFIKFRSKQHTLGEEAAILMRDIETIVGQIPDRPGLYQALTEAMTNVSHHAYPTDVDNSAYLAPIVSGKWWMSGSFNTASQKLTVMFLDQGVGIPFTLPRKHTAEKIRGVLDRLNLIDDDASRIRAAMELGTSKTGQKHRGGGLFRDIRAYTSSLGQGMLRVLSGKGEYIYALDENGRKREQLLTHSKPIGGTLILWEGVIPSEL